MADLERLKAFSPTLFLEAAVSEGNVEAIQTAEREQCDDLGCKVGEFGGHHINCYSFSYRVALKAAKLVAAREATS